MKEAFQSKSKGDTIMNRDWVKALSLLTQMGVTIAVCILLGVLLGRFLDNLFGSSPWLTMLCSILGIAAAFKSIFDLAAPKE